MATTDHGLLEAKRHNNETERSPEWDKVRDNFLKNNSKCAVCGSTENLNVHHIFPFHYCVDNEINRPDLELDPCNLITLCETKGYNHHLLIGHFDDYKSANLRVKTNATLFGKSETEIKTNSLWKELKNHRLKPLDEMTPAEKKALKAKMDSEMPLKS